MQHNIYYVRFRLYSDAPFASIITSVLGNCCAIVKPMRYAVAEIFSSTVNGTMESSATIKSFTP
jgi:hypothetical protein